MVLDDIVLPFDDDWGTWDTATYPSLVSDYPSTKSKLRKQEKRQKTVDKLAQNNLSLEIAGKKNRACDALEKAKESAVVGPSKAHVVRDTAEVQHEQNQTNFEKKQRDWASMKGLTTVGFEGLKSSDLDQGAPSDSLLKSAGQMAGTGHAAAPMQGSKRSKNKFKDPSFVSRKPADIKRHPNEADSKMPDSAKPASTIGKVTKQEDQINSGPPIKKQKLSKHRGILNDQESRKAEQHVARVSAAPRGREGNALNKFAERLKGSKFRWLNEMLYTSSGEEAFSLMSDQPDLFSQYHEGFQQQTHGWPNQPIKAAVKWLSKKPMEWIIADFGCGDAELAASVAQKVFSLDLVATQPGVIACNMSHTPLETGSVNVAVFCLALMGTDYASFLEEAARVLKPNGRLWIAEVRSRFMVQSGEDFQPFLSALEKIGFKLVKGVKEKMFVVFVLKRVEQQFKTDEIAWPTLKPCLYKRR